MKLIIFDFDGTLIDSAPDLVDSINEMLKEFNFKEAPFDEAIKWIGNGSLKLVERALKYNGIEDEKFLEKAHKVFKEKYKHSNAKKTTLYPFAKELLDSLKDKNLALITNKPDEYIKPILKKFDIDVFDFDGTLIDSAPDLVDSINEMLNEFNLKEAPFDEAIKWIGNGSLKLVERALKYNGIEDNEFLEKAHKVFKEKYKHSNAKKNCALCWRKRAFK